MFLTGTAIEKCDLSQVCLPITTHFIATFSCAEMMAQCENLISLCLANRVLKLQAK